MSINKNSPIAVVLLNLGGPEKLTDVQPFLFNLFSDRQIIRLGPSFLQKPIAGFISWRRAPKSKEAYKLIGGGSPLTRITGEQAVALEKQLQGEGNFRVFMAMRYWEPYAKEILQQLQQLGINHIVALPLYPHYSVATSGSSLTDFRQTASQFSDGFVISEIKSWQKQPLYIESLAKSIKECFISFENRDVQVVYSAHSLPVKFIDEGDPYVDHLKETIVEVEKITTLPGELCYQSRSGPVEWLSPSTPEILEKLAEQGCKNILMVPISFVSDHVETLYEIDILYRQMAEEKGMHLKRSESCNTRPDFINALKRLVLEAADSKGWRE